MKQLFPMLRGAMVAKGIDQEHAARSLLIARNTFSMKINARSPWTQDEQYALMDKLAIPYEQMHLYFPKNGIDVN